MPVADSDNPRGMVPQAGAVRSRGEDPYPLPCHSRGAVPENYRDVEGWGADLDPSNRPMFPMELPSNVESVRGDVGARQVPTHRIHVSNEMPDLTPVFGTSCPPHGLSGALRSVAFEYSEGTARHWLTLMLADRVDMVESAIGAVLRGSPDNIVAEKAWLTRLAGGDEKRRKRIVIAAGVAALVIGRRFAPRLAGAGRAMARGRQNGNALGGLARGAR
jgi:hypothetical protein